MPLTPEQFRKMERIKEKILYIKAEPSGYNRLHINRIKACINKTKEPERNDCFYQMDFTNATLENQLYWIRISFVNIFYTTEDTDDSNLERKTQFFNNVINSLEDAKRWVKKIEKQLLERGLLAEEIV